MKFTLEDLLFSLEVAAQVGEAYDMYVLHGKGRARSVDDMRWICSEYLGKRIDVYDLEMAAEGRSVKAACIANADGSFEIGLLAGMDRDELRFVQCKEIFHAMLDRVECRNLNLYDHVTSSIGPFSNALPNRAAAAEELAIIAAMEFLFPFSAREAILAAATGELDYAGLAAKWEIPLRFVEQFFDDQNIEFFREVMPMLDRDSPAAPIVV